jgi:transposase
VLGRSDDLRIWDSQGRWRDLPERLGNYQSVKRRYYRWIEMGVLDDVLAALSREADLEWLMIDSTIVRAHQHAAGARTEKGGADAQGLGRSRDGLSPKIHAAGDALGNPLRLIGTPGQRNDIAFAHELVDGFTASATIADKAMTPIICARGSPKPEPRSSSRPSETARSSAPTTPISIRSATSSSASSTSSNSSAGSRRDMTNCLSTSWALSNLPPSPSGSNN